MFAANRAIPKPSPAKWTRWPWTRNPSILRLTDFRVRAIMIGEGRLLAHLCRREFLRGLGFRKGGESPREEGVLGRTGRTWRYFHFPW